MFKAQSTSDSLSSVCDALFQKCNILNPEQRAFVERLHSMTKLPNYFNVIIEGTLLPEVLAELISKYVGPFEVRENNLYSHPDGKHSYIQVSERCTFLDDKKHGPHLVIKTR